MAWWKDKIDEARRRLVGKKVTFDNKVYAITSVDYNGCVLIDKPARFTPDTAVYDIWEVDKYLVP